MKDAGFHSVCHSHHGNGVFGTTTNTKFMSSGGNSGTLPPVKRDANSGRMVSSMLNTDAGFRLHVLIDGELAS